MHVKPRLRTATQQTLSPGGRVISAVIEPRHTFSEKLQEKFDKAAKKGRVLTQMEALEAVVISSGSSNKVVSSLNTFTKYAGPAGAFAGISMSGHAIYSAPVGQTGRVTAEEVGGLVGGAAFGVAGTWAAGVALGVAGVALAPAAVLAIGAAAGFGAAYYGATWGRQAGTYYYNLLGGK